MEGQHGRGALPCVCNEGARLRDVSYVDVWDEPQKWQGNKS